MPVCFRDLAPSNGPYQQCSYPDQALQTYFHPKGETPKDGSLCLGFLESEAGGASCAAVQFDNRLTTARTLAELDIHLFGLVKNQTAGAILRCPPT